MNEWRSKPRTATVSSGTTFVRNPRRWIALGGHEINDFDLSQLFNFGQIVIQWRVRKPKEGA